MTLSKSNGGLGIRDIQAFNDAYLAKISWRLKENPDCLLGRILLSKYCPDGNLLTCSAPSAAPHGWQSILVGRDLLAKNLGWIVGNGDSIKVWNDAWLTLDSPCRPMGPATRESAELTVKDLILEETGEWNRGLIQTILPFEEERILNLQPSTKGAPDALKWLGTRTGEYSVKSGYYTAMAEVTDEILEGEPTPEFDWKKTVWNLAVAPKVKMFMWKCLRGILPVGERLLARHININPACKRCGNSESINHLIFHCPFAREVWDLAPLDGRFGISGLTDLRADWTEFQAQKCLPPTGLSSSPIVPWIIWGLWKARSRYVFETFAGTPADILSQAIVAAKEWASAQEKKAKCSQKIPEQTSRALGTIARSDAAWSETTKNAGLGWTVTSREQRTMLKKGIGFTPSALVAEGLELKESVATCSSHGVKEALFESDSSQLISAINGDNPPLELYGIVEDIHIIASAFDDVVFGWISRERNEEADLLAKNALRLYEQEVVVALMPPPN
ncbi:uncharacterized protein LOC125601745 [Brassica napus]|uniref:uncharacterized protein LOC125601745 n=1 Tax=Brassica napus TaxID=3708 RepID=UPI002078C1B9|nr:uncharacterized protein LOC125601745 [Brassica napus]